MSEGKAIWWQEQTADYIVEHAKKDDIALLPIGAIEQHGPHCPCGDDSYNAIGMAEHISRKTGVMILPCPMYGSHPYHHWGMPGNIPSHLRNPHRPFDGYCPRRNRVRLQ